jgi:hypothetical protein
MFTLGIKDFKKRQFGTKQELCNYLAQYMKNVPYGARVFKVERNGALCPTNYVIGEYRGICTPQRKQISDFEFDVLYKVVNKNKKEDDVKEW